MYLGRGSAHPATHATAEIQALGNVPLTLHTIGDSHARFPWSSIPGVRIHWLGALLCHSVGRVEAPDVSPGDIVCVCLGEIDCRCHVHKHVSRRRPYTSVIDDLVAGMIDHMRDWDLPPDVKLAILNVPPPPRRKGTPHNPEYPFLGSDAKRLAYVRHFNRRAAEACEQHGFVFIDVYEHYADRRGFLLPPPHGDGHVHMQDPAPLQRAIRDLFGYA